MTDDALSGPESGDPVMGYRVGQEVSTPLGIGEVVGVKPNPEGVDVVLVGFPGNERSSAFYADSIEPFGDDEVQNGGPRS